MHRLAFVLVVVLLGTACGAAPFQVYPGAARPGGEVALVSYKGDGGITPFTWAYKIDGETRAAFAPGVLPFGFNKTHAIGGFALAMLPGDHSIELVLNNRRGPLSGGAAQIHAKRLRLRTEAGRSYRVTREGFSLAVAYDEKTPAASASRPAFSVEDVPAYAEPAADAPHATLVYSRAAKAEIDPYLLRVDGAVTPNVGAIPEVNYSLPVFKSFSDAKGALSLRLAPGAHRLEFMLLGGRVLDGLVQLEEVTVVAGKTYALEVVTADLKGSTLTRATLRLVER